MHGQISLEYLLLALVMLTLIGISLATLQQVQANGGEAYVRIQFEKDSEKLARVADELCAMGPGNSRQLLLQEPLNVTAAGSATRFERGSLALEKELPCALEEGELWGNLILENKEGKIEQKK